MHLHLLNSIKEYNIVQEKESLHYCTKKIINVLSFFQSWEKCILYFFMKLLNIENFIFNFAYFIKIYKPQIFAVLNIKYKK